MAATKIKYGFSDDETENTSGSEAELFENKDVLNDDDDKPKIVDLSSDSEIEKPLKRVETSEDLFESLIGMLVLFCLSILISKLLSFISAADKEKAAAITTVPPSKTNETKRKRPRQPLNSDSDSDDITVPKRTTKLPNKTQTKKLQSKRKSSDDDYDMSDNDDVKKKKKRTKNKSSEDEEFSVNKKQKGKKQKIVSSEDEVVKKAARSGRPTKKLANYVFDSDESD